MGLWQIRISPHKVSVTKTSAQHKTEYKVKTVAVDSEQRRSGVESVLFMLRSTSDLSKCKLVFGWKISGEKFCLGVRLLKYRNSLSDLVKFLARLNHWIMATLHNLRVIS